MSKKTKGITRRDFLNGTQIAIGASLLSPWLLACGSDVPNFTLPPEYYPPAKTGLRGSHDGSWETMHARVSGQTWEAAQVEAQYDLVVVGAGISGLSAAWFYRQKHPQAKILILDNHDDFGGHAKRNEFEHNGENRIGYGGTEAIDTPSAYSPQAKQLLKDIGIELQKFYQNFDQELYPSMQLSKSILFGAESFGENKLVRGYGSRDWQEFAADTPMSDKARRDFVRVQTERVDYLPGKSFEQKYQILKNTSYETFLRDYAKVDEQVIAIYKRWGMSFWCVGIDEIPTTSIQDYDGGMPGVEHTLPRTGKRGDEPYIFHFPDGNASVARLLVRSLNPAAVPGDSMEDVVTTRVQYAKLDRSQQPVNIRLNSTAVHVKNVDTTQVHITYVRNNTAHKVSAKHCIMACYNSAIPYLCPDMPAVQKKGLAYNVKVPLVYTKVLVPNWQAFAKLGTDFVYYTDGFYKQVELAYPVSVGDYKRSQTPDEPMVLHMCHVPWVPEKSGPEQWREGRRRILTTSFDTFEQNVYTQLNQALASTGFQAERDIRAITVNRWPHGYAYSPDLIWEPQWAHEHQ
ncbi:MAG: NAD(P)/FAD-dependent oxidoreductase, partial [Gammaproteobacteria bacterium]|nr:NAD(P)/FAD-dependent oxidoreductase [Gammaproteobacteria bacterium]